MRSLFHKYIIILLILIPISLQTSAQGVLPRPNEKDLVFDYAHFLSEDEARQLNEELKIFASKTSNQILFLSVETLNDLEPYEYAEEVLSTWGVGQKELNNGVVILIKPKSPDSRGQVFISTGYGLEGAIPDATTKLIVENEMLPAFRNGNNYEGVVKAVNTLMSLAIGEYNSGEYQKKAKSKGKYFPVFMFLFIMIIVFASKMGRAKRYASTNNLGFWAAFMLLSNTGRSHGGSYGGFSGGGGFGGFGGGMGGGGGAGGSW